MKRLALALIGLALLSACGVKGGLERPDPMWNREEALAREREQQQRDAALAARRAGQTSAPAATAAPTEAAPTDAAPTEPAPADTTTAAPEPSPVPPPQ